MKKIINNVGIAILSLVAFTILPSKILATDMWAETPDLNDASEGTFAVSGPATFKYTMPTVDMWAETPDLNTENSGHDFKIDGNAVWLIILTRKCMPKLLI